MDKETLGRLAVRRPEAAPAGGEDPDFCMIGIDGSLLTAPVKTESAAVTFKRGVRVLPALGLPRRQGVAAFYPRVNPTETRAIVRTD